MNSLLFDLSVTFGHPVLRVHWVTKRKGVISVIKFQVRWYNQRILTVLLHDVWLTEFCWLHTTECLDVGSSDLRPTVDPVRGSFWTSPQEKIKDHQTTGTNYKEPNIYVERLGGKSVPEEGQTGMVSITYSPGGRGRTGGHLSNVNDPAIKVHFSARLHDLQSLKSQ